MPGTSGKPGRGREEDAGWLRTCQVLGGRAPKSGSGSEAGEGGDTGGCQARHSSHTPGFRKSPRRPRIPPSSCLLLREPRHQPGWEAHVERTSEQEVSVQVVRVSFHVVSLIPRLGFRSFYSFSFTELRSL